MFCLNCGMENPDTALDCRRCHMEFTDEDRAQAALGEAAPAQEAPVQAAPALEEPAQAAPAQAVPAQAAADAPGAQPSFGDDREEATTVDPEWQPPAGPEESFGAVCRRCEAFNEPGVQRCTNCGYSLRDEPAPAIDAKGAAPGAAHADPGGEDQTPPSGSSFPGEPAAAQDTDQEPPLDATPPGGQPSLSDEMQALALSDQDARDAQHADQTQADATPQEGMAPVPAAMASEAPAPTPEPPPAPPASPALVASPQAAPADKTCESCGVVNPLHAKFCAECGTPFKKVAKAVPTPVSGAEHTTDPSTPKARPQSLAAPNEQPRRVLDEAKAEHDTEAVAALPSKDEAGPALLPSAQVEAADLRQMPSPEELAAIDAARLARKAAAARPLLDEPPAIEISADLSVEELPEEQGAAPAAEVSLEAVAEELPAEELPAEELPAEELPAEELPAEELPAAEVPAAELVGEEAPADVAEALPEEVAAEAVAVQSEPIEELGAPLEEPPFAVQLTVERGAGIGSLFALAQLENTLGGPEATIPLGDDPHLAPVHATVLFEDQKVLVRDEGTANGVYVKIRESAPIRPGDTFIAGERLFRYDGPIELSARPQGDTPLQGSPRPQGVCVRVVEVLKGGRLGRTCNRVGPVISIGKTGCDLNFPSDTLLGPRHAEIHLGENEEAVLCDLGAAPDGVLLRMHPRTVHEFQTGDVFQLGDQVLSVAVQ